MINKYFFFAVSVISLFGCSRIEPADSILSSLQEQEYQDPCLVPGILEVEFSESMAECLEASRGLTLPDELKSAGILSYERSFPDAGQWEERHRAAGLHRWYKLTYDPGISMTKASAEARTIPGALTVEIPRVKKTAASLRFNDKYNYHQWYLLNDGKFISGSVAGIDVNVNTVWDQTAGLRDVVVAVVDDGMNLSHADLVQVAVPAGQNGSWSFVDGHSGPDVTPSAHGTNVAGIIGAVNNNGVGVSSIAGGLDGNGGVSLLACQIMKSQWDNTLQGDDAAAIVWAADHGALVCNNSWGYTFESEEEAKAAKIETRLKNAIDYFIEYAGCDKNGNQVGLMKGGLVTFAAGNNNWAYGQPAAYEKVLAVGALSPNGKKATYSNYGSWVDICAPGGDIQSLGGNREAMIFGLGEDTYYYMEGTSQACPMVSAVAALIISYYGGMGFTCDKLRSMLVDGANYNYGVGEGIGPMLDAAGSFSVGGEEKDPVISSSYHGEYIIKGQESLEVQYSVHSINKQMTIDVNPGAGAVCTISGRNISIKYNDCSGTRTGKYTATIKATSGSGKQSVKKIEYEILENHAPEVAKKPSDTILSMNGTAVSVKLPEVFNDQDGNDLKYTYSVSVGKLFQTSMTEDNTLVVKAFNEGLETITLTATDPCGKVCSTSFKVGFYLATNGPTLYPNPVVDKMYVCTASDSDSEVSVYSSTGAPLGTLTGVATIISPLQFDMETYAPGLYSLIVKTGGKEYRKTVVKSK